MAVDFKVRPTVNGSGVVLVTDALPAAIAADGSGNAAVSGTLAVGVGSPQSTYLALIQSSVGQGVPALRINHNDTGTQDAVKIENSSSSYALKVDQLNSGTPHDTVNIAANFTGAHTVVGVNSQNTTLSTVKIANSAAQTGGQIIAAVGSSASRTAALFGGDNSGSGASYLSIMEAGATGPAFQAIYDAGGGYSSRALYISGNHTSGAIGYIENAGAQTAGALLQLAHLSSSSTAPLLQLSPAASSTSDQIAASNFRVNNSGNIATNQVFNYSGFANARMQVTTSGTVIDRNVNDANPVLVLSAIHASSTGDVLQIKGAGAVLGSRFGKGARFFTSVNSAPADADVSTSEVGMWFDNTSGAPKLTFKGKDSAAAVFTGFVPLGTDTRFTTITANPQTASYTAVLGDAGEVVEMNVASANNFTVPPNSSVAFPIGTVIEVHQYGAGQTTLVAGAGVTVRTSSSLTLRAQYSTARLRKRGTDEWVAAGDLT